MKYNAIRYGKILGNIGTLALAVLLLSIFVGCAKKQANPKANTQPIPQAVKDALDSTVRLVLKDAEGKSLEIGSGFFVRPDLIVTDLHVIEGAVSGHARLVGKKTEYPIESITRNEEYGLALLKVTASDVKPLFLGDSDAIQVDGKIYAVGNLQKLETPAMILAVVTNRQSASASKFKVGDRFIVNSRTSRDFELFWITVPKGGPVVNGGPVLSYKGKVIGISGHLKGLPKESGNFAISSKTFEAALHSNQVQ